MFYVFLVSSIFLLFAAIIEGIIYFSTFMPVLSNIVLTIGLFAATVSLTIKKFKEPHQQNAFNILMGTIFSGCGIILILVTILNKNNIFLNLLTSLVMITIGIIILFYNKVGYTKNDSCLENDNQDKNNLIFEIVYEIEQLLLSEKLNRSEFKEVLLNCEENLLLINAKGIKLRTVILTEVNELLSRYNQLKETFLEDEAYYHIQLKMENSISNFTNSLKIVLNNIN